MAKEQIVNSQKRKRSPNVSKKIKNGTLVMTRDEYFEDHNNYTKPKYRGTNTKYRDTIVIDSNINDELALIKIQSGGKEFVINKAGQVEHYNPHIKTKDNEGKPIKLGEKFERGNSKFDVSQKDARTMKNKAIFSENAKARNKNRKALKQLKAGNK